jgi:HPt (histidine-containing phosphotransfer) domain-containing protein
MNSDNYTNDQPQFAYLNEITGNNSEIFEQIVLLFITEAPKDLEKLVDFCASENWEATGKQAHKIKSSVANFGLTDLKELFLSIEQEGKQQNNIEQIPDWVNEAKIRLERVIVKLKLNLNSR